MRTPQDVASWLAYLEARHPVAIDMGLSRLSVVADRLGLRPAACPIMTVAGTNGKGSTVALLSALAHAHGLRVGTYTSPHLVSFHERIVVSGQPITDEALIDVLATVESARGDIGLSYFEHTTLAALVWFARQPLDLWVLEVGLGGRLDAVNAWDAAVAVITSVDLDHQAFLGNTRAAIAQEKFGIARAGQPLILGEQAPEPGLLLSAQNLGVQPLVQRGHAFDGVLTSDRQLRWQWHDQPPELLPASRLYFDNVLTGLAAWRTWCDQQGRAWQSDRVAAALSQVELPGRCQRLPGTPATWLDVGHNPHGVHLLWQTLGAWPQGKTHGVLAMLADKDIESVVALSAPWVDVWHLAPLPGPRGASVARLQAACHANGISSARCQAYDAVLPAFYAARAQAGPSDRVVVWGSFLTVAEVFSEEIHDE